MSQSEEKRIAIIQKFEPLLKELTTYELTVLNKMIVANVRARNKDYLIREFSKLKPGDHVSFTARDGILRKGIVLKFNRKTVSVKTDDDDWNVSPQGLKKIDL